MRPYPTFLAYLPARVATAERILQSSSFFDFLFLLVTRLLFVLSLYQHVKYRPHLSQCAVENNGFEPLTPCLQSRCSSQLS